MRQNPWSRLPPKTKAKHGHLATRGGPRYAMVPAPRGVPRDVKDVKDAVRDADAVAVAVGVDAANALRKGNANAWTPKVYPWRPMLPACR